jgi:RimJ/RimL family protein N-acetyltransferase
MRLVTERLSIAPLTQHDAPAFAAYRVGPEIARYQSWGTDYSLESALALARDQVGVELPAVGYWLQLGVHAGDELVGDVAVHLLADQPDTWELGMTFAVQGRGYATALLERVGLRQESRQVQADWFKGEWTTLDGFGVLASEWVRDGSRPGR